MGLKKTSVGDHCWLWSDDSTNPDVLVISAHGAMTKNEFKTGIKLLFYAPPSHVLQDPGLRQICDNEVIAKEAFDAGTTCPDHELSKYQGKKHGSESETYQMIERLVSTKYFGNRPEPVAVLTIRHRLQIRKKLLFHTVTLSETLGVLGRMGISFREVRCSFCRGTAGIFGSDPKFSPYNISSGSKPTVTR